MENMKCTPNSHNLYVTHQGVCPECGGTTLVFAERPDDNSDIGIAEHYLKGLYDYLDMVLDAEVDKGHREIYQEHQDCIKDAIRLLPIYKL
jgi:hypothetical protein